MCVPVCSTTVRVLMFSFSFAKVNFFSLVNHFDPSKVGNPSYKGCVRSRMLVKFLGCCAAGVGAAVPEAARMPHATAAAAITLFLTKRRRLAGPYNASRQRGKHIFLTSFQNRLSRSFGEQTRAADAIHVRPVGAAVVISHPSNAAS